MSESEAMLVYAVDDDAAVLKSLAALLKAHGFGVVACSSGEEFLDRFEPENALCVLLDIRMPGLSGLEVQERLVSEGFRVPIVILTGHGDVPAAVRAMKNGAIDFLEKPVDAEVLLNSLVEARAFQANRPRRTIPANEVARRLRRLTGRERQVLDHLLLGRINKEIAETLGISQRTVELHRARIREKMEARSLSDLIVMMG